MTNNTTRQGATPGAIARAEVIALSTEHARLMTSAHEALCLGHYAEAVGFQKLSMRVACELEIKTGNLARQHYAKT